MECVRLSGLREAYVQMTCTRGIPPSGTRDPRLCKNRFIAHVLPFIWIADEEQRRRGLRLTVSSVQRIDPQSVDPRVKNFHWLDLTRGMFEALDRGDEVAVLVDRNGHLTEGAGFNLFLVHDGKVSTPAANVFEGMTRRTVMELCKEMDIACVLETIPADRIRDADEVFLTSTAGGIMPVATVDGKPVGRESHVVTTRIHDLYWSRQTGGELSTPISYDVI